jgi:glyoxylase-like metal-dependent hydrolase (beta-lactamase superfamily II)
VHCIPPSFGVFADDPEQNRESWQRLRELGARMLYPAHGKPFPADVLG